MAQDLISKEQYAELRKAFLRCTSNAKRRQMIEKKAKKFALINAKKNGKTFANEYTINAYLGMVKPHLHRHKTTHQAYCEAHDLQVRPEFLTYTSDGVLKLMQDIGFKGTKTKKPEQLAKELVRIGGKDFFTKLIEANVSTVKQTEAMLRNEEFIRLHAREHLFADMLGSISNFSVIKGHDSWHSWFKVVELKQFYVESLEIEFETAKGTTKTVLKDLLKKLPSSTDLMMLAKLIEVNGFAVRLLSQWHQNENFTHLTDAIHDFALGSCVVALKQDTKITAVPTHQGCTVGYWNDTKLEIVRGKVKELPQFEIVFREDDIYIDEYHILFDAKDPLVKEIIKKAKEMDELIKGCLLSIQKKIGKKKISYSWDKFFTDSVTIDDDFQVEYNKRSSALSNVGEDWSNLYSLLNVGTDTAKSFGHMIYRVIKDKKTLRKS